MPCWSFCAWAIGKRIRLDRRIGLQFGTSPPSESLAPLGNLSSDPTPTIPPLAIPSMGQTKLESATRRPSPLLIYRNREFRPSFASHGKVYRPAGYSLAEQVELSGHRQVGTVPKRELRTWA